jgi:serine/threonine-protein kinase
MSQPSLSSLLEKWQEAFARGEDLPVEQLGPETLEQADELSRRIEVLRRMNRLAKDMDGGTTLPFPPPGADAVPPGSRPEVPGTRDSTQPALGSVCRGPDEVHHAPAVPGYEVLEELGRGGMGVVYRAQQTTLKRLVALKMVLGHNLLEPEEIDRFHTEAEVLARLHHPNIVQIYELGQFDGQPYYSMELVRGGSLARRLEGNPLPPRQAGKLLEVLARAMHVAHQQGIIHRDLKPSNILLAGGLDTPVGQCVPKITDFGLAKRLDVRGSVTPSGLPLGTPSYMAPEQAEGRNREIGPRVDIYGLGTILYEALTGQPPFKAATLLETLEQVCSREPTFPPHTVSRVPRDLETICLKCLEKESSKRYTSALEMAEDLRRYLAGEPIAARPSGPWERVGRWARRRPAVALLLGMSAVVLVGVLVGCGLPYPLATAGVAVLSLVVAGWWYNARLQNALKEVKELHVLTERSVERLHLLLETTRGLVNAADLDNLLRLLSEAATRLVKAERATIYLVDLEHWELWSKVALGDEVGEIRLPLGIGIAGTVALTGATINLPNAEADPRFNKQVDQRTGYKTRSLLTLPMFSQTGRVLGVFQLLNKRGGPFLPEDAEILSLLASSAAAAVENGHWARVAVPLSRLDRKNSEPALESPLSASATK